MGESPGSLFPLLHLHWHQDSLRCSRGSVWMLKEPPEHLRAAGGIEHGHWPERLTGKPVREALFSDNHEITSVVTERSAASRLLFAIICHTHQIPSLCPSHGGHVSVASLLAQVGTLSFTPQFGSESFSVDFPSTLTHSSCFLPSSLKSFHENNKVRVESPVPGSEGLPLLARGHLFQVPTKLGCPLLWRKSALLSSLGGSRRLSLGAWSRSSPGGPLGRDGAATLLEIQALGLGEGTCTS